MFISGGSSWISFGERGFCRWVGSSFYRVGFGMVDDRVILFILFSVAIMVRVFRRLCDIYDIKIFIFIVYFYVFIYLFFIIFMVMLLSIL